MYFYRERILRQHSAEPFRTTLASEMISAGSGANRTCQNDRDLADHPMVKHQRCIIGSSDSCIGGLLAEPGPCMNRSGSLSVHRFQWAQQIADRSGVPNGKPGRFARRGCLALWGVYQSQKKPL